MRQIYIPSDNVYCSILLCVCVFIDIDCLLVLWGFVFSGDVSFFGFILFYVCSFFFLFCSVFRFYILVFYACFIEEIFVWHFCCLFLFLLAFEGLGKTS